RVLPDQRLTACEVRLRDRKVRELPQHVLPLVGGELVTCRAPPARAADTAEIAVVGQEQLRDERTHVQARKQMLLRGEQHEEPDEPECLRWPQLTFLAVRNRFALRKARPSR